MQAWQHDTAHQWKANDCLSGLFWSSSTGKTSHLWRFFCEVRDLEVYVYSDESGVFDYKHRKYFVMAGLVFTSKLDMDSMTRRYRAAEKNYRRKPLYRNIGELKASRLSFDDRRNLFRLTSECERFAFIVNMNALDKKRIFSDSDSKQRYLDWVFKVGLKAVFQKLISQGSIIPGDDIIIRCFVDEHTTATNGLYGLEESIYQEFHEGTLNYKYSKRFNPILSESKLNVCVKYVNSEVYELVRAADIIANRVLFEITSGDIASLHSDNLLIRNFPYS